MGMSTAGSLPLMRIASLLVAVALTNGLRAVDRATPQQAASRSAQDPVAVENYDLVFLGPQGAVLLRLQVEPGRRSIEPLRREYAGVVFRTLDGDGSGFLEPAEAARIPQNGQLAANAAVLGEAWRELDTAPADEQIGEEELFAFIDARLGPRFRIERKTRLQQSVRLLGPLDADGDGFISRTEIEQGLDLLHSNDFDDDGTLSVAELQPFPTAIRQAMLQAEARQPDDVPLVSLITEDDRARACARLQALYGAATAADAPVIVPATQIGGLAREVLEQFDRDGDGGFDPDELRALLSEAAPQLVLRVQISRNAVQPLETGPLSLIEWLPRSRDAPQRVQLNLAGMPASIGASNNREGQMSDAEVIINQALVSFLQADADKNRYLNEAEYAQLRATLPTLPLPDVEFAGIDANADGMLTRDELRTFAETNAGLAEATLVLTVSDDARTLFEILDANLDNRLSPREFQEGYARVRRYDHDRDGRLGMNELRSQYGFVVSPARPQFLQMAAMNAAMRVNVGVPRVSAATAGPTWFRKMDRNQDGDVAWREFLGTREAFERIDVDGNGLIDLNEAAAVE